MNSPDPSRSAYGRERLCPHCGARVAQKAVTCFFCGASLEPARARRIALPWADIILFSVIGALLFLWWTRAPQTPDGQRISLVNQVATRAMATPTARPETVTPAPTPTLKPLPTETPQPTPTLAGPVRHVVQKGETLIQIAGLYNATVKDISDANGLAGGALLRIGQELLIPVAGPIGGPGLTPTPEGGALMVVVQSGDTISGIAERYKSQVGWIIEANKMQPGEVLRIGKALLVPLSATTPTPTATPEDTPTPEATTGPRLAAPILLSPADEANLTGSETALLMWAGKGTLASDEWYVVTVETAGANPVITSNWTRATSWRLPAENRAAGQAPTRFTWQVQVRTGGPDQPGEYASAPSTTRRFTW
jgi:LysM repeat protein